MTKEQYAAMQKRYKSRYSKTSMISKRSDMGVPRTLYNLKNRNSYISAWLNIDPQNAAAAFAAYTTISQSNAGITSPTFQVLASQVSSGEFAGYALCYDQYRILKVCMTLVPIVQTVNNNAGAYTNVTDNTLYAVVDYNDSGALGSIVAALDYNAVKIIPSVKTTPTRICFTPRVLEAVYNTAGAAVAGANVPSPWLSVAQTGISHFGVKLILAQSNNVIAPPASCWRIIIKALFQFKQQY